jgi:putative SOS response-associated peptidase YedK
MCSRFVLLTDFRVITEAFHIQHVACEYRPGDHISPGQQVAAVIRKDERNSLVSFRWGLIPAWARDPAIGNRMFNARAETIAEKPSFKNAFRKRRCLIVADGFYEWQKLGKVRNPFCFRLTSKRPFGFAGLHEIWVSADQQAIHTCTIITTASNELIGPIHDRMPVIIPQEDQATWLDPETKNPDALRSLLKPFPASEMTMEASISH